MWSANYYITDHLGSVRAVPDAEGEVLDTFDYMPYGSEISSTSRTTTDYRFTGKERQSMVNNSIYDSFARFQNTYSRFMSIDPKAESFYHISPYTYCAGDPVNLVDPYGEVCGVYYDEYGNYIADDNIDDDKLYITNKETADLWYKEMRASGDTSNALNILQSGSTEVDGIIIITRTSETQQYTRGEFLAIGSNNFSGYTMERPGPASYEAGKKLPIPKGLYDTIEREGQFHGTFAFRIFNDKVSIKRGILGHIGNTPDHSEGCILFGMGMGSGNSITESKIAMKKFEVYFQNKDNVKLIIR
jgi:RHS repeat-associated protein